jgi:uncharacterized protein involved in exopolysaccharide biosynthesis
MTEPLTQSPAGPATAGPATDPEPSPPSPPAPRDRARTALRRAGRRSLRRLRSLPAWSPLAAGVLAGGLLGTGYGLLATPRYTATSYVVAVPADGSDPAAALGFAQAYGRVATQLAVLADAQMWAHVPVATLERGVRTATSPDAPMVSVTATSADPEQAADMANAVARALTRHATDSADDTHVELRQFARATEPTESSSPSAALTGLVGASAGGLLGGLALLVRPRRAGREPGGAAAAVPQPASAADGRGPL